MTTATAVDLSPLWAHLDDLSDFDIPSDLTEIDAAWVFSVLDDVDSECIQEGLQCVTYEILNLFAYDLRDLWHTARCEQAEWDSTRRRDYE